MLTLHIKEEELYDEKSDTFINLKPETVSLEHSLISLSKWEAHYHKPFLSKAEKTPEETIYYIGCMLVGNVGNINLTVHRITKDKSLMDKIHAYIMDPACATTINHGKKKGRHEEVVTAEIIYYDMIALQIPKEYEKRHLNRLMTLIEVCSIKNSPKKNNNMAMNDVYAKQRAINEANKARLAAAKEQG